MSKRSTIGANPLDAVVSGNPLDTVVPGALGAPAGRAGGADPAVAERLEQLEADIRKLRMQVADVRIELAEVKNQLFRDSYLLAQVKEKLAGK